MVRWQQFPDDRWSDLDEDQRELTKRLATGRVERIVDAGFSPRYAFFIEHHDPASIKETIELTVRYLDRDPYDINDGGCDRFAKRINAIFPETERHTTGMYTGDPHDYGGHMFIYSSTTDLYYDAECPSGTTDWKRLPIVVRHRWREQTGDWHEDLDEIPLESC